MIRICSVDECERRHEALGLCATHRRRLKRTGSVSLVARVIPTCSVGGCTTISRDHGFCHKHFARLLRTGTTDDPKRPSVAERILSRVSMGADGCWTWLGTVSPNGYGQLGDPSDRTRMAYAHRVSYETFVGPIPAGLEIDHVCHTNHPTCSGGPCVHRRCVNPDHLEPVTTSENQRRRYLQKARSTFDLETA